MSDTIYATADAQGAEGGRYMGKYNGEGNGKYAGDGNSRGKNAGRMPLASLWVNAALREK